MDSSIFLSGEIGRGNEENDRRSGLGTTTLAMILLFAPIGLAAVYFKVLDKANRYYISSIEDEYDREKNYDEENGNEVRLLPSKNVAARKGTRRAKPLSRRLENVRDLLESTGLFGCILACCYVCEHHPPFPHGEKEHSFHLFLVSFLVFMVAALTTVKPCTDPSPLNRDQTEEWKGWMQYLFLAYHYFAVKEAYSLVRVLITAYVWMTGFGNFSFFYVRRDFGAVRVLQMLWRLNFLVVFLVLTMENSYMLYYICPLHTFYFFLVYVVMSVKKETNHAKRGGIRWKIFAAALGVWLLFDCPSIGTDTSDAPLFSALFSWVPEYGATCRKGPDEVPCPVGGYGERWEWYFRSSLDHWSTLLGMVFALNFPVLKQWFAALEEKKSSMNSTVKGIVGLLVGALFIIWLRFAYLGRSKAAYNALHPYAACIPIFVYIYLRNCVSFFRGYYLELLARMGKITLETYLLQHHVLLTSNAKTLLTFVPGWPLANLVVAVTMYILLSHAAYKLTLRLRAILLPDGDLRHCTFALCGVALAVGICSFIATVLEILDVHSHVGVVVLVCGLLAVNVILAVSIVTKPRMRRRQCSKGANAIAVVVVSSLLLIAYLVLVVQASNRPEVPVGLSKRVPRAIPSALRVGSLAMPVAGAFVVGAIGLMLIMRDSYLGATALLFRYAYGSKVYFETFSWESTYGTFHRRLGL